MNITRGAEKAGQPCATTPALNTQTPWTASRGWHLVLALIALDFVRALVVRVAPWSPTAEAWIAEHEYGLQNSLNVMRGCIWLFLVHRFSSARSAQDFSRRTGLSWAPTAVGWFAAWIAVGLGLLNRLSVVEGWTHPGPIESGFFIAGGAALWFHIIFVVSLGPFLEEVALRGFLYRAFRGSYGVVVSTVALLCVTTYFHWGTMSHSLYTTSCVLAISIVLCLVREHTTSLWNCVLCHAAYNASAMVPWPLWTAAMLLLLPLCIYGTRGRTRKITREGVLIDATGASGGTGGRGGV